MKTPLLFLLLFSLSAAMARAQVPANETFRYVNDGELRDYSNEYDATYRTTLIGAHPFQLMFYNTTPGAFTLAYRMGTIASESSRFWVWEANRGRPVGDGATLTFGRDGNLVLAEADGAVVWSTGTANKGVAAHQTFNDGSIALVDRKGKIVWQSFDHVTDTLLVGQSFRAGGPTKLVSRRSITENANGVYSLVMEPDVFKLYVSAASTDLPYATMPAAGKLTKAKFTCERISASLYHLKFITNLGDLLFAATKHDCTYSFLRLDISGNLVIQTYDDNAVGKAWKQTMTFFSSRGGHLDTCSLSSKCGSLGVCQKDKCISCPTARGAVKWSSSCAPPKRSGRCRAGANVDYYKVGGVDHFIAEYTKGIGGTSVEECRKKCNMDCNCLGFFHREDPSGCWLAPVLATLRKVPSSNLVLYIKSS